MYEKKLGIVRRQASRILSLLSLLSVHVGEGTAGERAHALFARGGFMGDRVSKKIIRRGRSNFYDYICEGGSFLWRQGVYENKRFRNSDGECMYYVC